MWWLLVLQSTMAVVLVGLVLLVLPVVLVRVVVAVESGKAKMADIPVKSRGH